MQFTIEASEQDMQLYFKQNDVIKLTWLPEEVVPSYLTSDTDNLRLKIELYQQYYEDRDTLSWKLVGTNPLIVSTANDGSEEVTIPSGLVMDDCQDQNLLCPVAFKVSVISDTVIDIAWARRVTLPSFRVDAGIWSGVAYLQSDSATETSLSMVCDRWANTPVNQIPTSLIDRLPSCPLILTLAASDNQFRREQLDSRFTNMVTGYAEGAAKFYHPGVDGAICYQQIVWDERFEFFSVHTELMG